MSHHKSKKRDNAKNEIGPASGRPGVEGKHSVKSSDLPESLRNLEHGTVHSVVKGERSEHAGQGHHGRDNRRSNQEHGSQNR